MKPCDKLPILLGAARCNDAMIQQRIKLNMKLVDPCLRIKLHYPDIKVGSSGWMDKNKLKRTVYWHKILLLLWRW